MKKTTEKIKNDDLNEQVPLIERLKKNKILFIFLFLLMIASIIFLGVKLYFAKPDYVVVRIKASPGNWWWVTPRPPDWLAKAIKVGDKEFSSLGKPTAEILSVNVYDAGGPTKDVYVYARLAASKNDRIGKYRYKGEPIEIGGPIALNLTRVLFPGMVVEINDSDTLPTKEYVDKTLIVRQYSKLPYSFDAIKVGETMTDGSEQIIAEIVAKEQRPAEKESETDQGQLVRSFSPVYSDYFITLRIKVEKRDKDIVFREEQYIKVGNYIWAMFPTYNLSGAEILSVSD